MFHLAHHRNNRSEHERFDYYAPHENSLIKYVQWYCILTRAVLADFAIVCIVYFFTAELFRWRNLFGRNGGWFSRQTSAQEFLEAVEGVPVSTVRLDILSSFVNPAALVWTSISRLQDGVRAMRPLR